MLKKLIFLWLTFIMTSQIISVQSADAPQAPSMNDMKFPALSENDIKESLKMLENLTPAELEELAQFGESIIKAAEAEGLDAREIFGIPSDEELQKIIEEAEAERVEAPEAEVTEPTLEPKLEIETEKVSPHAQITKAEIKQAQRMLKNIIATIENISQKAEIDRKTRDVIRHMNFMFSDIAYYFNALAQERLTKYLFDKEFEELYATLRQLDQKLPQLERQFDLPEGFYEGVNPYTVLRLAPNTSWDKTNQAYQNLLIEHDPQALKKRLEKAEVAPAEIEQKVRQARRQFEEYEEAYALILERERALQAFGMFIELITDAVTNKKVLEGIKKIMQKYEPEALKRKQEQEQLEAKARREQEEALRRRPPYTPILFEPPITRPIYEPPAPAERVPVQPIVIQPEDKSIPPTAPTVPGVEKAEVKDTKTEPKKPEEDKDKRRRFGEPLFDDKEKEIKEIKIDPKLTKKLENVEKALSALTSYIDLPGPIIGTEPTPAPRRLFKDIAAFLAQPVMPPYDVNSPAFVKMKQIHKALVDMTKHITDAVKEFYDLRLYKADQQKMFREAVRQLVVKYDFQEQIKDLLNLNMKDGKLFSKTTLVNIDPVKSYVLTGIESPVIDATIRGLNPTATNVLGEFMRAAKALREQVRTKKS